MAFDRHESDKPIRVIGNIRERAAVCAEDARYDVVVGNIGTVYSGGSFTVAHLRFAEYKTQSLDGYGRAGGESVILFKDGEIIAEHFGTEWENG